MLIDLENEAYRAVQQVGIFVEKKELEKALAYDRNQYEKGFAAACAASKKENETELKINIATSDLALLRQIGEEAAELAQAVFKYLRTRDEESPTPVSSEDALFNILNEMADITLCNSVFLADKPDLEDIVIKIKSEKLSRWESRIERRQK